MPGQGLEQNGTAGLWLVVSGIRDLGKFFKQLDKYLSGEAWGGVWECDSGVGQAWRCIKWSLVISTIIFYDLCISLIFVISSFLAWLILNLIFCNQLEHVTRRDEG